MNGFLSRHIFWVLQFVAWGGLGFLVMFINKLAKNTAGLLLSVAGFTLVGVIMTSTMRWFLKRYVNLDDFKVNDFLRICLIVAVTIALYPHVSYWSGYGMGKLVRFFVSNERELFNKSADRYDLGDIRQYIAYFFIVGGWAVFYFLIKILRRANNKRLERLELQQKVKQAQLNTLKGHINPQFIFNTMTNIKGLMLEDVTSSRVMLTKISEMLRYSLTSNNIHLVRLKEELEMVRNYVSLTQLQYGDRFRISYDIPEPVLQVEIPPMLLLNLVENAAKNGILQRERGGEMELKGHLDDNLVCISLTRTGGMVAGKKSSLAKRAIEQRLKLMYDKNVLFQERWHDEKTTYFLKIPVANLEVERPQTVTNS